MYASPKIGRKPGHSFLKRTCSKGRFLHPTVIVGLDKYLPTGHPWD